NRHRLRPVEDVLDEMEAMTEKLIFILDDNFYGYSTKSKEHAYAILEGMISRGIKKQWFTQTSLNIANDKKFLKLAAKSGCRTLLVGIEAEELDQLKETNKRLNIKIGTNHYKEKIRAIQKAGIAVLGTFIFGLDGDTPEHFNKRADFINRIGIDSIQTSIITPLPGTTLFNRAKKEGKILKNSYPEDWKHYNFTESVLQHPTMTTEEIHFNMAKAWQKLYNKTNLRKHFLKTWFFTKSFTTAYWSYVGNWQYRRIVFEDIGYDPDIPIKKQCNNKIKNRENIDKAN
ncbi:MAG: radical SAM protein, partial [Bacteroidota bacterium]|nr:radical SAM protein [Bacteroidota bacterium]